MSEGLSKYERETIIGFSDDSPIATVYTCNTALMGSLKRKGYTVVSETSNSVTFEVSKKYISFRAANGKPRKPMTEETKARLRAARMAQGTLEFGNV